MVHPVAAGCGASGVPGALESLFQALPRASGVIGLASQTNSTPKQRACITPLISFASPHVCLMQGCERSRITSLVQQPSRCLEDVPDALFFQACSSAALAGVEWLENRSKDTVVVSTWSAAPHLADDDLYPNLARTYPNDASAVEAREPTGRAERRNAAVVVSLISLALLHVSCVPSGASYVPTSKRNRRIGHHSVIIDGRVAGADRDHDALRVAPRWRACRRLGLGRGHVVGAAEGGSVMKPGWVCIILTPLGSASWFPLVWHTHAPWGLRHT